MVKSVESKVQRNYPGWRESRNSSVRGGNRQKRVPPSDNVDDMAFGEERLIDTLDAAKMPR